MVTQLGLLEDERREPPPQGGDRRNGVSFWRTDMGQKVVVALIVPAILAVAAYGSGMIELPSRVRQHDQRITNVEAETRQLRESAIRRDAMFEHIKEKLDEIAVKVERQDRRR